MGGISSSKAAVEVSGTLVFSGVVRLENNGGFATITGPAANRSGDDLSDFDSIALRVKGDGNIYQFWLYTRAAGGWCMWRVSQPQPACGKKLCCPLIRL